MTYRIALGGIYIESSTFTPYVSDRRDFTILEGEALLALYPWLKDFPEAECIPLIRARALPGGVVKRAFVAEWLEAFTKHWEALAKDKAADGLFLDLHGAMSFEGSEDAEGDLLRTIRRLTGPECCISASMDLHGNVSDAFFETADFLTAYRTAPHVDEAETQKRAFAKLLEIIGNQRKDLVRSKVDLPILLSGEMSSTECEPGKSLYGKIDEIVKKDKITDASIWMGFPWADQPRSHAVVAVTGYEREKTEKEAMDLAAYFWARREDFHFAAPAESPEEACRTALRSPFKPFFISDTGDNPGAGGAGDRVDLLKTFLRLYKEEASCKKVLFASVHDEESVKALETAAKGETVCLEIGGKSSPDADAALETKALVKHLYEDSSSGASAVLGIGNIDLVLTSKRIQFSTARHFQNAGLADFAAYDIVAVKMGYLEPDLSRAAAGRVMALSPGAADQNLSNLPFTRLAEPIYPLQKDFEAKLEVLSCSAGSAGQDPFKK